MGTESGTANCLSFATFGFKARQTLQLLSSRPWGAYEWPRKHDVIALICSSPQPFRHPHVTFAREGEGQADRQVP